MNAESKDTLTDFLWVDQPLCADKQNEEFARQFALMLIQGVFSQIEPIDHQITTHVQHWQFDRLLNVDKAILRISIFPLLFLSDIPPAVTINEAIELAKKYSDYKSPSFINGILDAIHKEGIHDHHQKPATN